MQIRTKKQEKQSLRRQKWGHYAGELIQVPPFLVKSVPSKAKTHFTVRLNRRDNMYELSCLTTIQRQDRTQVHS